MLRSSGGDMEVLGADCLLSQVNIFTTPLAVFSSGLSLASTAIRISGFVKVMDGECGLAQPRSS